MKRDRPTPDEARILIAYHERMLATTTSADRRLRSQRAIERLRQYLEADDAVPQSGTQSV